MVNYVIVTIVILIIIGIIVAVAMYARATPAPTSCTYDIWSGWGSCVDDIQSRSRYVLTGTDCTGSLTESQACIASSRYEDPGGGKDLEDNTWQYLKNEDNGLCANDVLSYAHCKDEDQFKWSNAKGVLRNKKSELCLVLPDQSSNILTTSECNYDLPSHQWNLDASNRWMNKESEGVCVIKDGACLSG